MKQVLLPNVKKEDLTQQGEEYRYGRNGPVIRFDQIVPYADRTELEDFIFDGSWDWNDLEVPNLPPSENGLGQAAVYYALYHELDLLQRIRKASRAFPTANLIRIFTVIARSCNMGLYSEVGIPRDYDSSLEGRERWFASPFNPSIHFHVQPKSTMVGGDRFNHAVLHISNAADGTYNMVEFPFK